MTAVMRPAEARLKASIMISSSMTLRFTGEEIGCTMKTSLLADVLVDPDEDVLVGELEYLGLARAALEDAQMARASAGCALPVKMRSSWNPLPSVMSPPAALSPAPNYTIGSPHPRGDVRWLRAGGYA